MAELNFGLLTPPGSQSIGNAFVSGMDQAAVARAQENQNALSQYTLSKARREDELTNKMLAGLQGATTIEQQAAVLRNVGRVKEANDLLTSDLMQRELRGKLDLQPTTLAAAQSKLYDDKINQSRGMLEGVTTPEEYIAWHEANHNDPILGKALASRGVTMEQSRARINKALQQPGGLERLINESRLGVAKFAEMNKPSNVQQSMGGSVRTLAIPGMGGEATVVPGSQATMEMTPGQVRAAADAKLSREQSERHFQAGGYTYDLDRGIRIDRNGIATPLMQQAPAVGGAAVGGGVSANAPVSGGIPTGRGSAAGLVPLGPKPEKLNESQGNATAFGLRMKESEAILEDLAKKGVFRGAMVESIPFVGGAAGKLLPSTLGGTTQQQQQVNQAKSNFITAVLRKESGAAIPDSEFEKEDNKYFPQLNDNPKVIQQKANARRLAIEAMKFQAGPGAKEIDKYVPSINAGTPSAPSPSAPPIESFRRP